MTSRREGGRAIASCPHYCCLLQLGSRRETTDAGEDGDPKALSTNAAFYCLGPQRGEVSQEWQDKDPMLYFEALVARQDSELSRKDLPGGMAGLKFMEAQA